MKKVVLIVLVIGINIFYIEAQSISQKIALENKYWVWRDRLVNDFMVPYVDGGFGNGSFGRGIIFNNRGKSCYFPYDNKSVKGGFDISDEGFQFGKYLIVLASEWKILKNSGLSTNQVEREIYYALTTLTRLDYNAEYYWNYFWFNSNSFFSGDYNGFMVRDDVFRDFIWDGIDTTDLEDNFFHYTPKSLDNYHYLNQGVNGNTGKYVKQNIPVGASL